LARTRPIRRRNKSRAGRTARSQICPVGRMFSLERLQHALQVAGQLLLRP